MIIDDDKDDDEDDDDDDDADDDADDNHNKWFVILKQLTRVVPSGV